MVHVWNPHSSARLATYRLPRKHNTSGTTGRIGRIPTTAAAGAAGAVGGIGGTHDHVHVLLHIPGQQGAGWVCGCNDSCCCSCMC